MRSFLVVMDTLGRAMETEPFADGEPVKPKAVVSSV
jgi:hypothetical protein